LNLLYTSLSVLCPLLSTVHAFLFLSLHASYIPLLLRPKSMHTEWQRPLSGIHSMMMEKLAQAGEDWGRIKTFKAFPRKYVLCSQ
jgi:hypothetical protein